MGSISIMHTAISAFPKLEGEIGPRMKFRGKEVLNWSLNNYLGLGQPSGGRRKADAIGAVEFGMATLHGRTHDERQTKYHEELGAPSGEIRGKKDAFLLNFGYQGMISIIDCLLTRRDAVVYDSEAHACIIDGLRMHMGKRVRLSAQRHGAAPRGARPGVGTGKETGGGILVITRVCSAWWRPRQAGRNRGDEEDFDFTHLPRGRCPRFRDDGPRRTRYRPPFQLRGRVDVLFPTLSPSRWPVSARASSAVTNI